MLQDQQPLILNSSEFNQLNIDETKTEPFTYGGFVNIQGMQYIEIQKTTCFFSPFPMQLFIGSTTSQNPIFTTDEFDLYYSDNQYSPSYGQFLCIVPVPNAKTYISADYNNDYITKSKVLDLQSFLGFTATTQENQSGFVTVPLADYCPSITNTCLSPETSELYCATTYPSGEYDLSGYLYTGTLEHSFYNLNLNLSNYFSGQNTTNTITPDSFSVDNQMQEELLNSLTIIYSVIFALIIFIFLAKFIKKTLAETFK